MIILDFQSSGVHVNRFRCRFSYIGFKVGSFAILVYLFFVLPICVVNQCWVIQSNLVHSSANHLPIVVDTADTKTNVEWHKKYQCLVSGESGEFIY